MIFLECEDVTVTGQSGDDAYDMPEHRTETVKAESDTRPGSLAIPAGLFIGLVLVALTLAGIGFRYRIHGDFDVIHALLILFLSMNLVVCYLEICLFLNRDYVERRIGYWRDFQLETGRTPALAFFASRFPLSRLLRPSLWADLWATYSQFDPSYADRRSYGHNIDIANGFLMPIPILVLYAAYSIEIVPAFAAGIIGAVIYWQLMYGALVYWIGYFLSNAQDGISRRDLYIVILGTNSQWVLYSLLGLHASIHMILHQDYRILGY